MASFNQYRISNCNAIGNDFDETLYQEHEKDTDIIKMASTSDILSDSGFGSQCTHAWNDSSNTDSSSVNSLESESDIVEEAAYKRPKSNDPAPRKDYVNTLQCNAMTAIEKQEQYSKGYRTSTKSSESSKSSSSSTLHDTVSSTSTPNSPLEDMPSYHEENYSQNSRCGSTKTIDEDQEDPVFTSHEDQEYLQNNQGFPGNSNQMDNETNEEKSEEPHSLFMFRKFSAPGTVTNAEKSRLQQNARQLFLRSKSYHPGVINDERKPQNSSFPDISLEQKRAKYRSCSDLGSGSFGSSKDDTHVKDKRQSFQDSSYGSKDDEVHETVVPADGSNSVRNSSSVETNSHKDSSDSTSSSFEINVLPAHICEQYSVDAETNTEPLNCHDISYLLEEIKQNKLEEDKNKFHDMYAEQIIHLLNPRHFQDTNSEHYSENVVTVSSESKESEESLHDKFCTELMYDKLLKISGDNSNKTLPQNYDNNQCDPEKLLEKYITSACETAVQRKLQTSDYSLKSLEDLIITWIDEGTEKDDVREAKLDCEDKASFTDQSVSSNLIRYLVMAKQCDEKDCSDEKCILGKTLYKQMISCLKGNTNNGWLYNIMESIALHSLNCDIEKCCVPYCDFFMEHYAEIEVNVSTVIVSLQACYFSEECQINIGSTDEFMPLQDDICSSMPEEGVHFDVVTRYKNSEKVFLAKKLSPGRANEYIIIKKSKYCIENHEVLKSIKGIQYQNLVSYIWAATTERDLYTTTKYETAAKSLRQWIQEYHPNTLPHEEILNHIRQLYKALMYLQRHEILYLNWTAEHVVKTESELKLCNFSTAVKKCAIDNNDELAADLCGRLPPFLIPPEMHDDEPVCFPQSDFWGFGCLCYEIKTGHHVHWEKRHFMHDEQLQEISKDPVPNIFSIKGELKTFLNSCFQTDPCHRHLANCDFLS